MSLLVISTVPDQETAKAVAKALVEERLAACVNIVPNLGSVYRWQGEVVEDNEVMLLIKTRRERYAELETRIRNLHPYNLPEVIALPIQQGSIPYLNWISESVTERSL